MKSTMLNGFDWNVESLWPGPYGCVVQHATLQHVQHATCATCNIDIVHRVSGSDLRKSNVFGTRHIVQDLIKRQLSRLNGNKCF